MHHDALIEERYHHDDLKVGLAHLDPNRAEDRETIIALAESTYKRPRATGPSLQDAFQGGLAANEAQYHSYSFVRFTRIPTQSLAGRATCFRSCILAARFRIPTSSRAAACPYSRVTTVRAVCSRRRGEAASAVASSVRQLRFHANRCWRFAPNRDKPMNFTTGAGESASSDIPVHNVPKSSLRRTQHMHFLRPSIFKVADRRIVR